MGKKCGMDGKEGKYTYTRILWGRLKERDHLEERVVDRYTYLFTPWSIVLLEKLTGCQLVN